MTSGIDNTVLVGLTGSIGALLMAFGGVGYMRYLSGGSFNLFGIDWASPCRPPPRSRSVG